MGPGKDGFGPFRKGEQHELPPYTGQIVVPETIYVVRGLDWVLAGLCAGFVLGVYLSTLPPTVTGEDSGELIVAAYTLGVPHPPGYPIWCLLAHPFTYIPIGSVGWRVALSSAVFASMAVFTLYFLALKVGHSRAAGMAAALVFAFSGEFWEQSVIAEVYALNALFVALYFLLLVLWYETRKNGLLYIFALLYGLSLTNHNTMTLLGPVAVLFVLYVDREPWRRWRLYASCVVLGFVGLSVYLYLPIRSLADPPVDWGNPENWRNFREVVQRKQYAFMFTEDPRTLERFAGQFMEFLRQYTIQFTPWLAGLPLIGLWLIWRNRPHRPVLGLLLAALFVLTIGFIVILNFDLDKQGTWVASVSSSRPTSYWPY